MIVGELASNNRGQMSVELAVLMPVAVVVALASYNLARFVAICAIFDRVAPDAIVSQGIAAAGASSGVAATAEVRASILESLDGGDECDVEVQAQNLADMGESGGFSLSSHLVRYTCTLSLRPWPSSFVLAGVRLAAPFALRHERTLVVDRYRPGVVI